MPIFFQSNILFHCDSTTSALSLTNIILSFLFPNFFISAYSIQCVQFSSVTQSCPTLCDPIDCRMSGSSVLRCLPEFAQNYVHWVSDAIQPSHPLSSPYPPDFHLSQMRVFSKESVICIRWPKYWSYSSTISPSNDIQDWFPLGRTG